MFARRPAGRSGIAAALAGLVGRSDAAAAPYQVSKTEAEWKACLTPGQYRVLREHRTEPPGSSALEANWAAGTYHCAGCHAALFRSEAKFESGSGWPSFDRSIAGAVATSTDYYLVFPRTEVHCRRCGGHLGHVFDDGPDPTGQRYCMNGLALTFVSRTPAV
jgi:peptide-methionine (R)-S-oxide reductase